MIQTFLPVFKFAGRQSLLVIALGLTGHAIAQSQSQSSSHSESGNEALLKANPAVRALGLGQMNTISDRAKASRGVGGSRIAGLDLGTGLAGAAGDGGWNGWAAQSYSSVAFGFAPLASSGHVNSTLFGADYSLAGGSLVGVAIGGDSSRTSTAFNNGSVSTNGYSIAPYFMMPLGARWTLDGSLGFGSGNVSQNAGAGVSGATSERRTFGSLGLTYATTYGNWQLEGNGRCSPPTRRSAHLCSRTGRSSARPAAGWRSCARACAPPGVPARSRLTQEWRWRRTLRKRQFPAPAGRSRRMRVNPFCCRPA